MNYATAPPKPLAQLRHAIRLRHFALSPQKVDVHCCRAFIKFHGLRNPREIGSGQVEAFLNWLAQDRQVSASTHRQALSALLLVYGEVLKGN